MPKQVTEEDFSPAKPSGRPPKYNVNNDSFYVPGTIQVFTVPELKKLGFTGDNLLLTAHRVLSTEARRRELTCVKVGRHTEPEGVYVDLRAYRP